MPAKFLELHPSTPDRRKIKELALSLKKGAIVIIPTDTIYAVACDIHNKHGIDQICRLIGKKPGKADLSLLCRNLSDISVYCRQIPNPIFKLMKQVLPGPFTFILNANNHVSKIFRTGKKTVGIRVPENEIVAAILAEIGNPLVSSSIHSEDEVQDYLTEPDEIYDIWKHKVDSILDGGAGDNVASTVLDCTGSEAYVQREGKGMNLL
jgi:tRNA threonylcarbamoyl adenosine modification protein (Sua5/YciO/YrdC/YwlC family)